MTGHSTRAGAPEDSLVSDSDLPVEAATALDAGGHRLGRPKVAVEDLVAGVVLAGMALLAVVAVLGRSVPGLDIPYSDQMLPDLLVWLAVLGAVGAVRTRDHLGMTILVDRLSGGSRLVLVAIAALVAVLFFVAVLLGGAESVEAQFARGVTSPAGYPLWVVAAAFPVGAALAIARLVGLWMRRSRRGDEDR